MEQPTAPYSAIFPAFWKHDEDKKTTKQPWVAHPDQDEEETLESIIDYLREHQPELWHSFVAAANVLKHRYDDEKKESIDRAIEKTKAIDEKIEGIRNTLKRIEAKHSHIDEVAEALEQHNIDGEEWWLDQDEDFETDSGMMPTCFRTFLETRLKDLPVDSALARVWCTDFAHAARFLLGKLEGPVLDWKEGQASIPRCLFYCYLLSQRPCFWRQASEIAFANENGYEAPEMSEKLCKSLIELYFPKYLDWIKTCEVMPIHSMNTSEENINWGQTSGYLYGVRRISKSAEDYKWVK